VDSGVWGVWGCLVGLVVLFGVGCWGGVWWFDWCDVVGWGFCLYAVECVGVVGLVGWFGCCRLLQ